MKFTAGIDISAWQDVNDWKALYNQGIRFVFIKATEANSYINPRFERDWNSANEVGLLRGAYHFFRPHMEINQQVDHFLRTVNKVEKGELPVVFDLEDAGSLSKNTIISRSKIWLEQVAKETGRNPILYSSPSFLNDFFSIPGGGPPSWANDFPLWIANYLSRAYRDGDQPSLPPGWKNWTFWQYSQTGSVNGIPGNVDLNWFNGTEAELRVFAGQLPLKPKKHIVVTGETLQQIASRFQVGLTDLLEANPGILKPGTELEIPLSFDNRPEIEKTSSTTAGDNLMNYEVQKGENLWAIAKKFNTTTEQIARKNNITDPDLIKEGQVLIIPRNTV